MSVAKQGKPIENSHGRLLMTKFTHAVPFRCGKCERPKKSKNVAEWKKPDGSAVDICNGCYDELLADG